MLSPQRAPTEDFFPTLLSIGFHSIPAVEKINLKLIKGINLHRVSAPEKRLEVTWSSLNVHTRTGGWKNLSRCVISKSF
jgi:hypothetical protein